MSFGYSELENNNQQPSILQTPTGEEYQSSVPRSDQSRPTTLKNELKVAKKQAPSPIIFLTLGILHRVLTQRHKAGEMQGAKVNALMQ